MHNREGFGTCRCHGDSGARMDVLRRIATGRDLATAGELIRDRGIHRQVTPGPTMGHGEAVVGQTTLVLSWRPFDWGARMALGLAKRAHFPIYLLSALLIAHSLNPIALSLNPTPMAQSSDQVHLAPNPGRTERRQPTENMELKIAAKPLRVDVDLVLVSVTVTDNLNRPVVGLTKDDFALSDGGYEQYIRFFSSEDTPLSVGLVLDVSSTMKKRISTEREALAEFFKYANPQDDYFAIAVSDRPILLADSTQSLENIQAKLASMQPAGYTALMDSIYLAASKMQSARYGRRVILIISDGGENDSRYKLREIAGLLAESDILVYAIRPCEALPMFRTIEEKFGNRVLARITEATGGRTVSLANSDNVSAAAAGISMELRNQYVLGYRPADFARDGKWHKIKVRLIKSGNPGSLKAHHKNGYAAPTH